MSEALAGATGVLALLVWIVGMVEVVATWLFMPWAFAFGIRVVRRTVGPWTRPPAFDSLEIATRWPTVRARMIAGGDILFRIHIHPLSGPRTALPFKGTIRWVEGQAVLELRVLSFPIAFLILWLVGWTVGAIAMSGENLGLALLIWSIGATGVASTLTWSARLERRRAQHALDQLADRMMWPRISL